MRKETKLNWRVLSLALLLGASPAVWARAQQDPVQASAQQEMSLTGVVMDQNNEPIIGATIMVVGTTNGTTIS